MSFPASVTAHLAATRAAVDAATDSYLLPELLNLILEYARGIPLVYDRSVRFGGGVFEYLGTRAHTRPWSNPAEPSFGVRPAGMPLSVLPPLAPPLVQMYMSREFESRDGSACVERCIGRHYGNRNVRLPTNGIRNNPYGRRNWIEVDLGENRRLIPEQYALMNDAEDGQSFYFWDLQATNDGVMPDDTTRLRGREWLTIDRRRKLLGAAGAQRVYNTKPSEQCEAFAIGANIPVSFHAHLAAATATAVGTHKPSHAPRLAAPKSVDVATKERLAEECSEATGALPAGTAMPAFRYFRVFQLESYNQFVQSAIGSHNFGCSGFELYGTLLSDDNFV